MFKRNNKYVLWLKIKIHYCPWWLWELTGPCWMVFLLVPHSVGVGWQWGYSHPEACSLTCGDTNEATVIQRLVHSHVTPGLGWLEQWRGGGGRHLLGVSLSLSLSLSFSLSLSLSPSMQHWHRGPSQPAGCKGVELLTCHWLPQATVPRTLSPFE